MLPRRQVQKYTLFGPTLGSGKSGVVRLASRADDSGGTSKLYAVKIINRQKFATDLFLKAATAREVSILWALREVNHPNITRFIEPLYTSSNVYLVFEYIVGGDLCARLAELGALSEEAARVMFRDLVCGLGQLHGMAIAHRDIKPDNCLLDGARLKIADFGLASIDDPEVCRTSDPDALFCGTPHYAAPEVSQRAPYCRFAADVWSLGVVLYVMLVGQMPFYGETDDDVLAAVYTGEYPPLGNVSPGAANLISGLIVLIPAGRLSLQSIGCHPWITDDGALPPVVVPARFSVPRAAPPTRERPVFAPPSLPAHGSGSLPIPPAETTSRTPLSDCNALSDSTRQVMEASFERARRHEDGELQPTCCSPSAMSSITSRLSDAPFATVPQSLCLLPPTPKASGERSPRCAAFVTLSTTFSQEDTTVLASPILDPLTCGASSSPIGDAPHSSFEKAALRGQRRPLVRRVSDGPRLLAPTRLGPFGQNYDSSGDAMAVSEKKQAKAALRMHPTEERQQAPEICGGELFSDDPRFAGGLPLSKNSATFPMAGKPLAATDQRVTLCFDRRLNALMNLSLSTPDQPATHHHPGTSPEADSPTCRSAAAPFRKSTRRTPMIAKRPLDFLVPLFLPSSSGQALSDRDTPPAGSSWSRPLASPSASQPDALAGVVSPSHLSPLGLTPIRISSDTPSAPRRMNFSPRRVGSEDSFGSLPKVDDSFDRSIERPTSHKSDMVGRIRPPRLVPSPLESFDSDTRSVLPTVTPCSPI